MINKKRKMQSCHLQIVVSSRSDRGVLDDDCLGGDATAKWLLVDLRVELEYKGIRNMIALADDRLGTSKSNCVSFLQVPWLALN